MKTLSELERWLSVDGIAFHLGVSKESIYRWAESGKMPAHKLGRQWKFKASEVDEWIVKGQPIHTQKTNELELRK